MEFVSDGFGAEESHAWGFAWKDPSGGSMEKALEGARQDIESLFFHLLTQSQCCVPLLVNQTDWTLLSSS